MTKPGVVHIATVIFQAPGLIVYLLREDGQPVGVSFQTLDENHLNSKETVELQNALNVLTGFI